VRGEGIKWVIKKVEGPSPEILSEGPDLSPTVASLLAARGISDPKAVQKFLNPDLKNINPPFSSKSFRQACEILFDALEGKKKIVIYGDYDVDGVCSTVIVYDFLKTVGFEVSYYIPDRFNEGYGLNTGAVEALKRSGAHLLITVDCGISNVKEIRRAVDLGMKVIITDHHRLPLELPPADVILHPDIEECEIEYRGLAGVGVSYYLLIVLRRILLEKGVLSKEELNVKYNLRKYLDLVALATVADVAPLDGDNRTLVSEGLRVMEKTFFMGLHFLKLLSGVEEKISTFDVGFKLAPRLNAGGRMSRASGVVALLLADEEGEALERARKLHLENNRRKHTQDSIMGEIVEKVERSLDKYSRSIVLASDSWHEGVTGICAGKLAEKYAVPSILFSLGEDKEGKCIFKGSARSIPSLDIYEALVDIQRKYGIIEGFGGHRAAAGLSIRKENLQDFALKFDEYISENLSDEDFDKTYSVDMDISFADIDEKLVHDIERMEPFGERNPVPLFMTRGLYIDDSKILKDKHWKGVLVDPSSGKCLEAIAFNMAHRFKNIDLPFSAVYHLEMNTFNGRSSIQLNIQDIKPLIL